MQLQKHLLRVRLKRGGGTVFVNILVLYKKIDVILNVKDNMKVLNLKIGKQRINHYDAAKLGYLTCLTTKIEISH